jgi:hypothetical protein
MLRTINVLIIHVLLKIHFKDKLRFSALGQHKHFRFGQYLPTIIFFEKNYGFIKLKINTLVTHFPQTNLFGCIPKLQIV